MFIKVVNLKLSKQFSFIVAILLVTLSPFYHGFHVAKNIHFLKLISISRVWYYKTHKSKAAETVHVTAKYLFVLLI